MSRLDPKYWDFACPDWQDRLARGDSLVPKLPLHEGEAARAVEIFDDLKIPNAPGMPRLEQAAGDWFRDIVRAIFGSVGLEANPIEGQQPILRRMVRELFCLVPKKNSKSTGGAAIMLTALIMNVRPLAEFILVGPTQEIANIAFKQASGMVRADERLDTLFKINDNEKTILHRETGAVLKVKTFDVKIVTGAIPAGVLVDELHVLGSVKAAMNVIGQLRGGMMSQPEAFLIFITTQSDEPPQGVFKAELQHARAIRDGRAKSTMLPVLYELSEAVQTSEDKQWREPKLWALVNPNLGRSIQMAALIEGFEAAEEKGEEELRRFVSQHLNVEIGLALHAARWTGADHWPAATAPLTLTELLARCEVVTLGIDGGGLDDLLGLYAIGREKGQGDSHDRRWLGWGRAWVDRSVLDLRPKLAPKLEDLKEAGELVIIEEPGEDLADIATIARQMKASGLFPKKNAIGLDPAGVSDIVDVLDGIGIKPEQRVGVPQGYRLSGTIKGCARRLKTKSFAPADQALMTFCVGNAKAELVGNAVKITKQLAGAAKIDPLQALFNAYALMAMHPKASGRSYMDSQEMVAV